MEFNKELSALTQLAIENSSISIYWANPQGCFVYVNDHTVHSLGYTKDEMLSMRIWEMDPNISEEEWPSLWENLKKQKTVQIETIQKRKDGSEFPVEIQAKYVEHEGKEYSFAFVRDITESKQARKELEREKELAENYLNIVGVMIVGINKSKQVMLINRKGCEILGYSRREILGKNWFDSFLPEDIRGNVASVADKLFKGEIEPLEYYENPVLRKDGEERLIAWHNAFLRNEQGKIIGLLSSGEDITDQRLAQQELLKAMKEKETLLQEVHHRVKNNLLTLYSLLNLQKLSLREGSSAEQSLEDAKQRISAMGRVHRMLYASKNFSEIDFADYIHQLIEEIRTTFCANDCQVQVITDLDPVVLDMDKAIPCGLILNELLVNAFRYAFRARKQGCITVSLKENQRNIEFKIKDDGVGMDFDPLSGEGKTLGLRLVVMLGQQLGANIVYEGSRGSLFTIVI